MENGGIYCDGYDEKKLNCGAYVEKRRDQHARRFRCFDTCNVRGMRIDSLIDFVRPRTDSARLASPGVEKKRGERPAIRFGSGGREKIARPVVYACEGDRISSRCCRSLSPRSCANGVQRQTFPSLRRAAR